MTTRQQYDFPEQVTLRTPVLTMAGQSWNNVNLVSPTRAGGTNVKPGREVNATLTMRKNAPWLAAIRYLY